MQRSSKCGVDWMYITQSPQKRDYYCMVDNVHKQGVCSDIAQHA